MVIKERLEGVTFRQSPDRRAIPYTIIDKPEGCYLQRLSEQDPRDVTCSGRCAPKKELPQAIKAKSDAGEDVEPEAARKHAP